MAGIRSFGGYVPRYRMNRGLIVQAMAWMNPVIMVHAQGEKAVANYDEDPVTMAVAAGIDALRGTDLSSVEGVYFASTTAPYRERLNAGILIPALNIGDQVRAADFGGGLKAGTTALLSALESVESGRVDNLLVTAADCRLGKAASTQEMIFGDAAAAFLVGRQDVLAEFQGSYSVTYDFTDHVRLAGAAVDRQWEERWVRDMGYARFIPEAVQGLLQKLGLSLSDFARVIYACSNRGARKQISGKLGLEPGREQSHLQAEIGDCGTSQPLVMLAHALESSRPGDRILVVSYGSGCDALCFQATERVGEARAGKGVTGWLGNRKELDSYTKLLVWRELLDGEAGMRGEVMDYTALSALWRRRKEIFGLWGSRCTRCGTPQFPPQRICANPECSAVDSREPYRFSDKVAQVISFTGDMLTPSLDPPAIYGRVEFQGGGRGMFDFTDCAVEELSAGKAVSMTFRRKYHDKARNLIGYYWKAVPLREGQ